MEVENHWNELSHSGGFSLLPVLLAIWGLHPAQKMAGLQKKKEKGKEKGKRKKESTAVQNMNTWKLCFSHQRTGTPCWEWQVMTLELITKCCNLRDKNLSPELCNTKKCISHTLSFEKTWASKQQNEQKLVSKWGWKSPDPIFTWKPLVLITAECVTGKHQQQIFSVVV